MTKFLTYNEKKTCLIYNKVIFLVSKTQKLGVCLLRKQYCFLFAINIGFLEKLLAISSEKLNGANLEIRKLGAENAFVSSHKDIFSAYCKTSNIKIR